jgi:hypothetical protein
LLCGKVDFCIALFVVFLRVFPHRVDFPQFEVKKVVEKRVETCAEVEENVLKSYFYVILSTKAQ